MLVAAVPSEEESLSEARLPTLPRPLHLQYLAEATPRRPLRRRHSGQPLSEAGAAHSLPRLRPGCSAARRQLQRRIPEGCLRTRRRLHRQQRSLVAVSALPEQVSLPDRCRPRAFCSRSDRCVIALSVAVGSSAKPEFFKPHSMPHQAWCRPLTRRLIHQVAALPHHPFPPGATLNLAFAFAGLSGLC